MAARSGMSNLITELRQRAEAGTAEYSLDNRVYFSDEDLQAHLDRHRADVTREALRVVPTYQGSSAVYQDYYFQGAAVEDGSGGTAVWRVEDGSGSLIGTANYTVNGAARHIRFTADQGGATLYLTYRAYDLDRAEADVWERKAAHVAQRFDVDVDNHALKRSQLYQHFTARAVAARGRAPARVTLRVRGDAESC